MTNKKLHTHVSVCMVLHLPALNFHCGFLPANLVYPVDTGCIFHAAVDNIGWNSEHCHFNNAVVTCEINLFQPSSMS